MVVRTETTRLSQSELWTRQTAYYREQGPRAWHGSLPLYVTSNTVFVRAFAGVVHGYLHDIQPRLDAAQPIYVVELGCGAGRFTHGFLRCLGELLEGSPISAPVVLVASDVVQANLDALRDHPLLQEAFQDGRLDLALFDATADSEFALQRSGVTLGREREKNPMVFIANYLFDSLPCDLFRRHDSAVLERHVPVSVISEDPEEPWREIELIDRPLERPTYSDPDLELALSHFCEQQDDGFFSIPVAGMRCWKRLAGLSDGQMLVLSADKGGATQEMSFTSEPNAIQHHGDGCISLTVNFRALGHLVQTRGGAVLHREEESSPLAIVGFLSGDSTTDFEQTRRAYDTLIDGCGPEGFYQLKCVFEQLYDQMSVQQLIAWLHFADAEPTIMHQVAPWLAKSAAKMKPVEVLAIESLVERSWRHHFPIGEAVDLPFRLGQLLLAFGKPQQAQLYFERSLEMHAGHPSALCNVAMCQLKLKRPERALSTIQLATERHPALANSAMVKLLLQKIQRELTPSE